MIEDLPELHIRLIFAVMMYRAGLATRASLRRELVEEFGATSGAEIADIILGLPRAAKV